MKKTLRSIFLICLICLIWMPIQVSAVGLGNTAGGGTAPPPSGGGGGTGGGTPPPPAAPTTVVIRTGISGTYSGSGGGGSFNGTIEWPYYAVTPKVTAVHSLNALLRDNHKTVIKGKTIDSPGYYVPTLEQLPINLEEVLAYRESNDGTPHRFAAVYTGYYNNQVLLNREIIDSDENVDNVGKYTTSTGESAVRQTSRALMLMGADLQLQSESCDIYQETKNIVQADYKYLLATGSNLRTETAVMNIYKALKQYQYEYKFTWVVDDSLTLADSPIQSKIQTLILATSANPRGIDTSEGKTWVWVTRTNPDLYWEQCARDDIFGGGSQFTAKPTCSDFAVPFNKARTDNLTLGEFCVLARSMMYLYGEPEMSEQEQLLALNTYNMNIPTGISDSVKDSVIYLAAKGIIDPSMYNYSDLCTYENTEEILLRIRDTNSRIAFDAGKYNTSNYLFQKGYTAVTAKANGDLIQDIEVVANAASSSKFDYFVEAGTDTFFYNKDGEIQTSDFVVKANGTALALNNTPMGYEYLGLSSLGYYHFKIPTLYKSGNIEVSIPGATKRTVNNTVVNSDKYSIPAGGGVYSYTEHVVSKVTSATEFDENGKPLVIDKVGIGTGTLERLSFTADDAVDYPKKYLDVERQMDSDETGGVVRLGVDDSFGVVMSFDKAQLIANCDKMSWQFSDNTKVSLSDFKNIDTYGNSLRIIESATKKENLRYQVLESYKFSKQTTGTTYSDVEYVQIYFPGWSNTDDFLKKFSYAGTGISTGAYYSSQDGTALIDFNFFVKSGKAFGMSKCGDRGQNRMFVTSEGINVYLNNERKLITVGTTTFKVPDNEELFHVADNTTYINAKAAYGWASGTTVMKMSSGSITVLSGKAKTAKAGNITSKTVNLPFSASTTLVSYIENAKVAYTNTNVSGVLLSGIYPLSNYICYIDIAGGNNRLYYLSHRNVVPYMDTSEVTKNAIARALDVSKDTAARTQFESDFGMPFPDYPDYILQYKSLKNPDIAANIKGDANKENNLYYCQVVTTDLVDTKVRSDIGYVYVVPEITTSGYKEYVNGYLAKLPKRLLPFVKIDGKLYDINFNMFKASASDAMPSMYGTLPSMIYSSSRDTQTYVVFNGKNVASYGETASKSLTSAGKVMPAPAGLFNFIYGFEDTTVTDIGTEDSVYFGTQKCAITQNKISLNGFALETDEEFSTISTVLRRANNTAVYRVGKSYEAKATLLSMLEDASSELMTSIMDPQGLVDWDKYSFDRLVEQVDDMSTILLIFTLNVLPRIGMLLFFIVLGLSSITNVKPWRMFCERIFDIYKVLTLGKQDVNTINPKMLLFKSIIAIALFGMLQDGVFFLMVAWVSEFIIRLSYR